jgi:hypothetical protein
VGVAAVAIVGEEGDLVLGEEEELITLVVDVDELCRLPLRLDSEFSLCLFLGFCCLFGLVD